MEIKGYPHINSYIKYVIPPDNVEETNVKPIFGLPKIPMEIQRNLVGRPLSDFSNIKAFEGKPSNITKSHDHCNALNDWCRNNISPFQHYGVKIVSKNLEPHVDTRPRYKSISKQYGSGTSLKFYYVMSDGGNDVITKFWTPENKLIESVVLLENVWYLFNVSTKHSVEKLSPWDENNMRYSVDARLWSYWSRPAETLPDEIIHRDQEVNKI